jgi:Protein of unknown function (DUF1580)
MAIDLTAETPIPLTAAARLVPPARRGKRTHLSTLLRWVLTGAVAPDGTRVRLEAVRLGGRWMTSRESIQRFALSLTPRLGDEAPEPPRSRAARARASDRAATELGRRGV